MGTIFYANSNGTIYLQNIGFKQWTRQIFVVLNAIMTINVKESLNAIANIVCGLPLTILIKFIRILHRDNFTSDETLHVNM